MDEIQQKANEMSSDSTGSTEVPSVMKSSKKVSFPTMVVGIVVVIVIILGIVLGTSTTNQQSQKKTAVVTSDAPKYRILHIMSYHTPWKWTEDQLQGFKDGLKVPAEYRIYEMDTKRKSTDIWKEQAGKEARDLIENWKPDLVYTNDDNAQKYVGKYYLNSKIPFVASGINQEPSTYGYDTSTNHTGVLEREHFVETVKLLKELAPNVTKIVVIADDDPTWIGVMGRMKEKLAELPQVTFVSWETIKTFDEYKQTVGKYQSQEYAFALLGVHTFKDNSGNNVPWQDVLQWTTANSTVPDFSFFADREDYGTLVSVAVSGYEQGLAAGKLAHAILVDQKSPSELPMQRTVKGQPVISLARAKKLGIRIPSDILLSADVKEKFAWEN